MKPSTILIGYPQTDASGNPLGAPRVVSGPPGNETERQAQAKLFDAAKRLHQFPRGIRYIAFVNCVAASVAAQISAEVSAAVLADHEARDKKAHEDAVARQAKNDARIAAHKLLERRSKAAWDWDKARVALRSAKAVLDEAARIAATNPTELAQSAAAGAKEKYEAAQKAEAAAAAEFEAAKAAVIEAITPPAPAAPAETEAAAKANG